MRANFDMIVTCPTGRYAAYRPATATYGQIFVNAVEACQYPPFDAPDLDVACRWARYMFGTGAFAVMRPRDDYGRFTDGR